MKEEGTIRIYIFTVWIEQKHTKTDKESVKVMQTQNFQSHKVFKIDACFK